MKKYYFTVVTDNMDKSGEFEGNLLAMLDEIYAIIDVHDPKTEGVKINIKRKKNDGARTD